MYLNCKTNYSFRYGTFFTEELVRSGVEFGAKALVLTNINNTCDAWDFVLHCQKQNIKPILGAEIRNGDKLLYILIARNSDMLVFRQRAGKTVAYRAQEGKNDPNTVEQKATRTKFQQAVFYGKSVLLRSNCLGYPMPLQ